MRFLGGLGLYIPQDEVCWSWIYYAMQMRRSFHLWYAAFSGNTHSLAFGFDYKELKLVKKDNTKVPLVLCNGFDMFWLLRSAHFAIYLPQSVESAIP